VPRFDILNLGAERDAEGKIRIEVQGEAASFVRPLVDRFVRTLNGLKVIAEKDGGNVYNLYNPPQPSAAGIRALVRKLKDILYGHVFPATVNIAVTARCQCRCVHCSADLFRRRDGAEELSTDEVRRVVEEAVDLGANLIVFTGGEPLLRRDIFDLIRFVDKTKAVVMMFSNGLGLDEENVRRLSEAGLYSLNISLDGDTAEVHDGLRRVPGSFTAAREGARRCREAGILTGVSTYATRENLASGGLARLIALARDDGFSEVTVFDCIPSGRFLDRTDFMLTPEEKRQVMALGDSFHRSEGPFGVVTMARVNSPLGAGCFGGFTQMYVTAFGDVNPCDFNPVNFGSVREFPLEAIWERMVTHPEYGVRKQTCRMQSPRYRKMYIDPIPPDADLPVPIEALPGDGRYLGARRGERNP
jgi:MoaA/NifB/PqqE/SkfB family radical SAM enzyme